MTRNVRIVGRYHGGCCPVMPLGIWGITPDTWFKRGRLSYEGIVLEPHVALGHLPTITGPTIRETTTTWEQRHEATKGRAMSEAVTMPKRLYGQDHEWEG